MNTSRDERYGHCEQCGEWVVLPAGAALCRGCERDDEPDHALPDRCGTCNDGLAGVVHDPCDDCGERHCPECELCAL